MATVRRRRRILSCHFENRPSSREPCIFPWVNLEVSQSNRPDQTSRCILVSRENDTCKLPTIINPFVYTPIDSSLSVEFNKSTLVESSLSRDVRFRLAIGIESVEYNGCVFCSWPAYRLNHCVINHCERLILAAG